jgi:hypothetical protein
MKLHSSHHCEHRWLDVFLLICYTNECVAAPTAMAKVGSEHKLPHHTNNHRQTFAHQYMSATMSSFEGIELNPTFVLCQWTSGSGRAAQHYNQQIVVWALDFFIIRTETQYYDSNDDTNG